MTESERSFDKMLSSCEHSSQIEKKEAAKKDLKNNSSERSSPSDQQMGKKGSSVDSSKKGKQPAKKSTAKSTPSTSEVSQSTIKIKSQSSVIENKILDAITNLQSSIKKQNEKMNEHDKQLKEFASKMAAYEYDENEHFEYDEHFGYDADCQEYSAEFDCQVDEERSDFGSVDHDSVDRGSTKRKAEEDENNNSRFKAMSKRFKASEPLDSEIDQLLAENITELFRSGIDEVRYNELVQDETTARPSNCEGLVVVQTNPMIWESLGAPARSVDKKMQNIETSVVKSAIKLAKVVDKMAKMEGSLNNHNDSFSKMIDECNDVLALLGQSNKQINLARKDFLRPEINREYIPLCNHNRPFTKLLFGDDVSKSAKEIEDCSKISNRMFQCRPARGYPRRRPGRFSRFRGGLGRGMRGRGQGPNWGDSGTSVGPKNFPRRGARPYRQ